MRQSAGAGIHRAIRTLPLLAFLVFFPPVASATSAAILQCTIIDSAGGQAIPGRCSVTDSLGINRYPPPGLSLYHTALGGYFYADGGFSVVVPLGRVVVRVGRGFEYRDVVDTLSVRGDTSIVVALERFISMDSIGWYPGDSHVHINHAGGYHVMNPARACWVGRSEGLSVINCLDNAFYFTGAPDTSSTPDCIVYMTEEMRSSTYGHVGLLGISQLIEPFSPAWWPLLADVADSVHASPGTLVVSAHPVTSYDFFQVDAWPGTGIARELPVDCIADRIDAMDIMSYSNCAGGGIELDLWYRLLNCGFRLPASAGTDASVNRLDAAPAGGFRVYVEIPGDSLSYGAWIEGLRAGRSFVTNGPLITHFDVGALSPGDSCQFAQPGTAVPGAVSVRSVSPVSRVDIVVNGAPALSYTLDPPRCSFDTSFTLTFLESSWIAARVHGVKRSWLTAGSALFAHTSPVYCTVAGWRICDRDDAAYFVPWIENLETLVGMEGEWADPGQEPLVLAELAAARVFYELLASGGATGAEVWSGAGSGTPPALACGNAPNPFAASTSIEFTVGGAFESAAGSARATGSPAPHVRLDVYDVAGRLVRRLVDEPRPNGRYRMAWDGRDDAGRRAASGVYFARLSASGRTVCRKMLIMR